MASTTGTLSARRLNRPPPNTARSEVHKAALSPDLPEETSLEVVKALIDAGADINAGRQWRTHLGEFVTKGHLEVADLLIRHGADVNTLLDDGKTALDIAIEQENDDDAALLRERGGLRADELS